MYQYVLYILFYMELSFLKLDINIVILLTVAHPSQGEIQNFEIFEIFFEKIRISKKHTKSI